MSSSPKSPKKKDIKFVPPLPTDQRVESFAAGVAGQRSSSPPRSPPRSPLGKKNKLLGSSTIKLGDERAEHHSVYTFDPNSLAKYDLPSKGREAGPSSPNKTAMGSPGRSPKMRAGEGRGAGYRDGNKAAALRPGEAPRESEVETLLKSAIIPESERVDSILEEEEHAALHPELMPSTHNGSDVYSYGDGDDSSLRSGEDAIAFFAQCNDTTEIKFVHLNRAETGLKFRPYDLVVVAPDKTNPEYFTMSASGLVHVQPGQPSEFIPLSEWMRQSTCFNVIASIPFYKNYIIRKCFSSWRSNIRYKLYKQQRKKLEERLFLARESFCAPLLEVQKIMQEVQVVQLMDLKAQKTYECASFLELQNAAKTEAAKHFEASLEKIQGVATKVCQDVAALAKSTDAFQAMMEARLSPRDEGMKSIVAQKQEQVERQLLLRRAALEASRLADFIRVTDYITTESLVQLCIRNTRDFLEELLKPTRKIGLFETSVQFGPNSTDFSPPDDAFQSMIKTILEGMISTVSSTSRILYVSPFSSLVASSLSSAPQVGETVRASEEFNDLSRSISAKMSEDFADATEYVKVFDGVRPIFDHDRTWQAESYSAQSHTVQSLKGDLLLISQWEKELEKMRVGQSIGVLYVESRKLKQQLLPMTSQKLECIKGLLRELAKLKCQDILFQYKQRIQSMQQRPLHLKEYSALVEKVSQLREEARAVKHDAGVVEDMYRLLSLYGVKVSSEEMVQLDDLRSIQETFKQQLEETNTFIGGKLPEMTQQLDANIARLNDQVLQVSDQLKGGIFTDPLQMEDPGEVLAEMDGVRQRLELAFKLSKQYSEYQTLFGLTPNVYNDLAAAQEQYQDLQNLWNNVNNWNEKNMEWLTADFLKLNVEELAKEVSQFFKEAFSAEKKLGLVVTKVLKEKTEEFKQKLPVIMELGNPAMKQRHWQKLFDSLGQQYDFSKPFTLEFLFECDVLSKADLVSEISGSASGESQLESSLEKIRSGWQKMQFTCLNHRDQKDLFILGGLDEVTTLLEDNQVTLQTMIGSRFIAGVRQEVEVWEKKLSLLSETLDEWTTCQRNWMYLETIFSAEDIQKQLPVESQKFQLVDKSWRQIMKNTAKNPLCIASIDNGAELLQSFQQSNKFLEEIQQSLEDYLETKRMAFPRFYFLSNDELLEILSQTRDPQAVQPHLVKCFDAMKSLEFTPENEIVAMKSAEGERVAFKGDHERKAEGPVESWLLGVERAMRETLHAAAFHAWKNYPPYLEAITRNAWLFSYPAQVVILVDQILWTFNCSQALSQVQSGASPKAVEEFLSYSLKQIEAMVTLVRNDLDKQQRNLLGALLTIDVHARDVVRTLVSKKVSSITDFEWTAQLRYYWEVEENKCTVRQTNTRSVYGFEYLGNCPRLVITPLTDICYMTLTGALHLKLGGAPAGPAGTGKTETTKDLAKALARQCVVFNCSDGLDYKIMGRFFSGLAQAGAWACFDEFNRIDIEVLSVIAQQILCIQQAILRDAADFEFEGTVIPLNQNFGVFITMNPGYAGRTELPDNLKALFRPVAMMVPDYRLIAEIVLFSEGFANALPLSNKMAQLYSLSSEQLSKQDHYDFGMRAVKSVLVAAGQLKRKEPETHEDLLLIRAMRDSNVPKFLMQDLPLFKGIISDLFPGVDVPFVDYGLLQQAIEKQLEEANLQKTPSFVTKMIQVHETQLVRHGLMLVGETASGKTTNVNILARALGQLYNDGVKDRDGFYKIVQRLTLNPKSITAGQLYGEFNLLTNEWTDGLVPKLVRQCVQEAQEGNMRHWVIFDGPVDAVWIENMNTVLDDNKTLCLANSERIKLPASLHMMFEVQDLKVASPATVSRCGMVYMEQVHVGKLSLAESWERTTMAKLLPSFSLHILELIKEYLPLGIAFIRQHCRERIPSNDANLTQSLLNLLTSCYSEIRERGGEDDKHLRPNSPSTSGASSSSSASTPPPSGSLLPLLVDMYFLFSFVWSIGANIDDASREKFNDFCIKTFVDILRRTSPIENVYNYTVDRASGTWKPWTAMLETFVYDPKQPYFNILVPTADTTRFRSLLHSLVSHNNRVLFMGETGVGKSVIIQRFMENLSETPEWVCYAMTYSAQTRPQNLKDVFETKLEKKRKTLLGPPSGKRMLMFIDDLNMPMLEQYGAQPPNELLRQVIDQGGFYDTGKLFFKNVKDVLFVAACAPPGGGRNEVTPRLLRHFNMIWIPNLQGPSMQQIFRSILSGFLSLSLPHCNAAASPLVSASVEIYQRVEEEMLPTPSKSHYTFNLRDLSKVFQGVLMVNKNKIESTEDLVQLWLHEEARVFRDRLVDEEDRQKFNLITSDILKKHLGYDWKPEVFKDLLYGDYMTKTNRSYQRVTDMSRLQDVLSEYLEEFNMTFPSQMHLVFFSDAIYHLSRICRILRQPRGNALLVGVGGSGRQSLTRLASFILDYRCFSIEITRGYGSAEFHEDLKKVLFAAGAENKGVTFLFSDSQIVQESFLEDINNILNTGDVPNIYEADEIEKIINEVRPIAKQAGKLETRDAIMSHYVQLVRENLHVVLAFSPIGAAFRNRCRMFPSLVNCCTIDWFSAWPEDALYSVAHRFLDESKTDLGIEEHVEPLCRMAVTIHRSVEVSTQQYQRELKRHSYTTPTSYLELIRLYVEMLRTQRTIVMEKEKRYRVGLQKLAETEAVVASLQQELTELQPTLEHAQRETSHLLVQVAKDQEQADQVQLVVEGEVQKAALVAREVQTMKDDCQKDLDEALPALYASIRALDALDKKHIQELKSFTNPPKMVGITMEAVCLLMNCKPDWAEAKKLLGRMTFLEELKTFDKDNIPPATIKKLKKYMDNSEFVPENIKTVSMAATSICMWVRAMYTYDTVAKNIAPKREKLSAAEAQLAQVQAELNQKQSDLRVILAKVADLRRTLEGAQQRKIDLEHQQKQTVERLARAEQLIDSLKDEKDRWTATAEQLAEDMVNLVGNIVLSAGSVAYLGPFTSEFRRAIARKWVLFCLENSIPVANNFSLVHTLADPVTVRDWNLMGLPADEFSVENGMFATMGRRWPLMIDPQGQANKWVRNMFKTKNLQIIKLSDKDFLRTLENGIRYGAPVLLENVQEELDPALEPVLLKQTFKKSGQVLLRLGDSDVPYSDEFRFFITTKLSNPHYMPEVCIKVTIINFTVTLTGLEEQLLVEVIRQERPDLEQKKDALTVNIASDKKQLKEIEDKILFMLANASGNILDDKELIHVLAQSKVTATAIGTRMAEAEATRREIDQTREQYRPIASRGSVIYFVIANLSLVDPMYQYSLQFFMKLFKLRLQQSEKSDELSRRLEILLEDITRSMYVNICRGLFEKDKLIYAFMICTSILRHRGSISEPEWKCFLVGPGTSPPKEQPPSCLWIQPKAWADLCAMDASLPGFRGLIDSISLDPKPWQKAFLHSSKPQSEALGDGWDSKLDNMQKLLILRAFREEKVVFGIREFVAKELGQLFTESPPFDLEGAYNDSAPDTPLIFILSPGADITDYLLQLAASKGKEGSRLKIISLGQGQGPIAERLMAQARTSGDWVCLQNCHLAVSWLGRLEQDLEQAREKEQHKEFRLWLTSMPSPKFPVPILQNGIKITNEPPKGLKANLRRAFADMTEADYERSSKPRQFKKLLFAVVFYNALILERRKFGAVGWNIPYEWMNSDLKAAIRLVQLYLEEQDSVPWTTLNVMVADITYGGRITDQWDKRTNSSIMKKLLCPELLEDGYPLTESGEVYVAPIPGSLEECRDYINRLPNEDSPVTFGLHPNADINFQQKDTRSVLQAVITMGGTGGSDKGGAGGTDNDKTVFDIATAIEKRMPLPFDEKVAHPDTFKILESGSMTSLGVFLSQELIRFNKLIAVMRSSLAMLKKAIKGLIVMSGPLENMYNGFLLQRVPKEWEAAGYPCLKPLASWTEDFFKRIDFLTIWLVKGPPSSFWLPGFFFPQGFMTAVKQVYSRQYRIAIDTLRISSEIMDFEETAVEKGPEDGAYIHGLFMEGARFDRTRKMMAESIPGELFNPMPVVWLKPVQQPPEAKERDGEKGLSLSYPCPLYKTSLRAGTLSTTGHSTNFVVTLDIPTDREAHHWIRRGCALLCMLDT